MKHSEVRQFLKEANANNLSPIEKDVFQYYFSKTQNAGGVWNCPDAETADELFRSRNGVCAARKSLIARGWITDDGNFNIKILKNFSVRNETQAEGASPKSDSSVSNETHSVRNETQTGKSESEMGLAYKEEDKFKEFKRNEDKKVSENVELINDASEMPKTRAPEKSFFDNPNFQTFAEFYPNQLLTVSQVNAIENRIRDGTIWRKVLEFWTENNYRAESIGKMCKLYDEMVVEGLIRNGSKQNGTIQKFNAKPNDAGTRNAERIVNTNTFIEQLLREGEAERAEQNLSG